MPRMTPGSRATLAAVGSILLWCWTGVCFAVGGRLAGPMAFLSLMCAAGVLAVVVVQAVRAARSPASWHSPPA